MSESTTTTDDTAPSAAPAEQDQQWYTIRHYRIDRLELDPIYTGTTMALYVSQLPSPSEKHRITMYPSNEPNVIEVYDCRTPMHALAVFAAMYAISDDLDQTAEEHPQQMLTKYQQEQQEQQESDKE